MLFKSLVTLSVMALGVAASPIKRETGPWCDGWWAGYDDETGFTLTAYNLTTASDPNAVGYPLVLGQAGAIDGAAFHVLSVSFLMTKYALPRSLLTTSTKCIDGCFVPLR